MPTEIEFIFRLDDATMSVPIYARASIGFERLMQAMADGVKAAGGTATRIDNTPTETQL